MGSHIGGGGLSLTQKYIIDELKKKLNFDGYSELTTVGTALQLLSNVQIEDKEPYIYRYAGGRNDIGDRAVEKLVGGSVVWNQLFAREKATKFNSNYVSYSNGVYTVSFPEGSTMSSSVLTIPIENFNSEHVYYTFFKIVDDTNYGEMRFQFPNGSDNATSKATLEGISSGNGMVRKGGTYTSFVVSKNSVYTTQQSISFRILCFDLTAAVTPLIADYIYTLETANAGDGVAWFRKYFPGIYYGYCEPHFEHVQVSAKNTVGFNRWDEETELGYIGVNGDSIIKVAGQNTLIAKHLAPVFGGSTYHFNTAGKGAYVVACKNADGTGSPTVLANIDGRDFDVTIPNGYNYIRFHLNSGYGTTYNHNVCVNLHGDRDGEYEPYRKRTYPIEPKVLRGVPKLDSANRLYFDGDIYEHDGTVTRRYPEIDMSTMAWSYDSTNQYFYTSTTDAMIKPANGEIANIRTVKYVTAASITSISNIANIPDKSIVAYVPSNTFRLLVKDSAYTTVADFKASLSGQMLIYEAKEPTTETAEPFQSPMVVDPLGTEDFIDAGVEEGTRDVSIPVGHETLYPMDLRSKAEHLPSLASADGRYCIQQTGTQMVLVPDTSPGRLDAIETKVPNPPSEDGTYELKSTVSNGTVAYSWVSAT